MLKGLLIKDIYVLSKQMRFFIFLIFVFALIPKPFMQGFALMYTAMVPVTALACDEQAKWDVYAQMMPYRAKDMVVSKYLLTILTGCLVAAVELCAGGVYALAKGETFEAFVNHASVTGLLLSVVIVLLSLFMPLVFKMGVEKGRIAYILMLAAIGAVIGFTANKDMAVWNMPQSAYPAVFVGAAVISLAVSIPVSIKVYKGKNS